jgi:DNA-binding GntR family transcriptional regulator
MPRSPKAASAAAAPVSGPRSSQRGLQIVQELRARILNWHYPPRHHLSEAELCAEFASSRVPVREALQTLVEQGLVEKVLNQGCFVRQPDAVATQHLYDLRLALELFVVERLARTTLPADVAAALRATWEPWVNIRADDTIDGAELVRADETFHLTLAQTLGNPLIVESLADINDRLRFVRLVVATTPHRVQTTAGEHLAILDAIGRKDAELARRTVRQNLSHARNKIEIAIARALVAAHGRQR